MFTNYEASWHRKNLGNTPRWMPKSLGYLDTSPAFNRTYGRMPSHRCLDSVVGPVGSPTALSYRRAAHGRSCHRPVSSGITACLSCDVRVTLWAAVCRRIQDAREEIQDQLQCWGDPAFR